MFANVKLSKTFWVEALMETIYVINRSPSVCLDKDIPQRLWTIIEGSCLANVNVAKDQREKLDPKTQPCIFLVYDDDEFNYQPWDLAEKKVTRS